jgi:hypothetical protein
VTRFIPLEEIEAATDEFLKKYHPDRMLPIPIEEILDLKMKINIVPHMGLSKEHGIESFLSVDLLDLHIDQDNLLYRSNRARFSLAHETGHLVLHWDYIKSVQIETIEDWKEIILGRGTGHAVLETQANMFANLLLMPTDLLEKEFEKVKNEVKLHPIFESRALPDDVTLAPFIAKKMAQIFNVSEEVAQYRLINWITSRKR